MTVPIPPMPTPLASLAIFQGETQIAVEGFLDVEQSAAWTTHILFSEACPYPNWNAVRPDTHDDQREVLSMLQTINETARFLVRLDYPEAEVMAVLRRDWPHEDAEAAYAQAVGQKQRCDDQVAAQLAREAAAARASELDLSKSIHGAP